MFAFENVFKKLFSIDLTLSDKYFCEVVVKKMLFKLFDDFFYIHRFVSRVYRKIKSLNLIRKVKIQI